MRKIINHFLCFLCVLWLAELIASPCFADFTGGQPGQFLQWGAGARAFGLGSAFFSISDDASATYWNPAGLTQLDKKEFMALHVDLFPGTDTTYDFLSFVYPTARLGVVGANLVRLYSGGFEKVTIVQTDEGIIDIQSAGTFDDDNLALTVAYGKKVVSNISVGVATKLIQRTLDKEQDTMWTNDLTLLMQGLNHTLPKLNIALGIKNIIHLEFNTGDELPIIVKLGVSHKFLKDKLIVSSDFEKNLNATPSWAIGLEYWIVNFFALRVGFNGETGIRESNIGLGFKTASKEWGNFGLDFAFALHELGNSIRFSGTWRFGKSLIQNRDALVRRLLQEALEVCSRGNFLVGFSRLEQAFNVDPGNEDVQRAMSKLQEIIAYISRATADTEEENAIRKGVISYLEENVQGAVNSFRYGYYKNPENTKLLTLLNRIEKANGLPMTEEFREEVVGWTLIDQKIYDARQAVLQGKYDEALIRCQEVLNLEPKNTTALEVMGSAFFMMNQPDKAIEIWTKVLEIDPANKVVQEFLNELK